MNKEFLSVGELADMMGTTVRTLQYYDREGLLKPSAVSKGGRRLYSSKDIVRLHQILSFKYLGFSLKEIKDKLLVLDNPEEVAIVLEHQKNALEDQIDRLTKVLQTLDSLRLEVLSMHKVDFSKYAEIIEALRVNNDGFWVWDNLNTTLKEHIRERFGINAESGIKIYDTYKELVDEAVRLIQSGASPKSRKSKELAGKWWAMVMEFTGGDMSLLPELEKFNNTKESWDNDLAEKQKEIDAFIGESLACYLAESEEH